jgi:glucose/mannose-6-phosphate isomerase
VKKRFKISEKLLSGKRPYPEIIQAEGETILEQLLWSIQLGDFVSIYLALLNGLNPTPVDLIERLKEELKD